MSQWSQTDPGAGDLSGIHSRMAKLATQRDHAVDMVTSLSQQERVVSESWKGTAHSAWASRAADAASLWTAVSTFADDEHSALRTYAAKVEDIKERAAVQRSKLVDAQAAVTSIQTQILLTPVKPSNQLQPLDVSGADATNSSRLAAQQADAAAATAALGRLAGERQDADDALVSRLTSIRSSFTSSAGVGLPAGLSASSLKSMDISQLLSSVSHLSRRQLQQLVDNDPALAQRMQKLDIPTVAAWWKGLPAPEREDFVIAAPQLIGNLEGVDYRSRSAANIALLPHLLAEAKSVSASDPDHAAAQKRVSAIEKVNATLGADPAHANPPLQLVLLDLSGDEPKAAVSVGDMDTASHISYNVPGMGTNVAHDMQGWTVASKHVWIQQRILAAEHGDDQNVAVVAYIGYDTPKTWLAEDSDRPALTGGDDVARALNGAAGARGWSPKSPNLAAIAFSYGTTTTAIGLTKSSAGNYVMVGSAGLSTGRVSNLNVPAGHVYSGHAPGDHLATVGQIGSMRWAPETLGANTFSTSDSHAPNGQALAATTEHADVIHGGDPNNYGYYDSGTTSVYNIAAESMGYPDMVAK